MPIQFEDQPNDKFVIYVTELTNRVMIFFMAGNFSREECLRFIAYYPTEEISIAPKKRTAQKLKAPKW